MQTPVDPRTGGPVATTRLTAILIILSALMPACGLFGRANPTMTNPVRRPETSTMMIDRGASPRRLLRYRLDVGESTTTEIRLSLHVTQRPDDGPTAQRATSVAFSPPLTWYRVRLEVTRASDDGYELGLRFVDAGIDPEGTTLTDRQIVELTANIQALIGVSGTMGIDRRGSVNHLSLDRGTSRFDLTGHGIDTGELQEQLHSAIPVLPSEPVGRGARWRTTGTTVVAGTRVRQSVTYELASIERDQVLYRAKIAQEAPEQPFGSAADGGTSTASRLVAAQISGTLTGRFTLTSLAAESETRLSGSQLVDLPTNPPRRFRQELNLAVSSRATGSS